MPCRWRKVRINNCPKAPTKVFLSNTWNTLNRLYDPSTLQLIIIQCNMYIIIIIITIFNSILMQLIKLQLMKAFFEPYQTLRRLLLFNFKNFFIFIFYFFFFQFYFIITYTIYSLFHVFFLYEYLTLARTRSIPYLSGWAELSSSELSIQHLWLYHSAREEVKKNHHFL